MKPVRPALSETAAVTDRHGSLARRDYKPLETFFDNVADGRCAGLFEKFDPMLHAIGTH